MKNGGDFEKLELLCRPIGIVRTSMHLKFQTPHQPKNSVSEQNIVELYHKHNLEQGLQDLESFDRIWLVWWFHKNATWKPTVLPPRGTAKKRGLFSTRSPYRPNPIGITAVPLLGIRGRKIIIGNTDLLDGTPILDIKPYISTVDSFPTASLGWIANVEAAYTSEPKFSVVVEDQATDQINWLRTHWKVDFIDRAREILEIDPSINRTRRIRALPSTTRKPSSTFKMGCGAWRVLFTVDGFSVRISAIAAGYSRQALKNAATNIIPDRDAQIAFNETFL